MRAWSVLLLGALALILTASSVRAQSQVRVNDDQTTIWRPSFTVVADIVAAGTILDVVGKMGTWYEVELPRRSGSVVRTGFVAVSRVTPLDQKPLKTPERRAPGDGGSARGVAPAPPAYGLRLFVQGGYGRFAAKDTFATVLGHGGGGWFGGGLQFHTRAGLFAEVAADRFQELGSRVFISNGEVFDLGVEDTVRIVPVTAAVGYRFTVAPKRIAYVSVGGGRTIYNETSPGSTEEENVEGKFNTRQVIVGFEFGGVEPSVATAFEFQYSMTPDALAGGVAAVFDEHDLGGLQFRIKLLFGR